MKIYVHTTPVHECVSGFVHNQQKLGNNRACFNWLTRELWYIHTIEHHLAIKRNNLLILTVTWWITNVLQNSNAKWKKLASTGYRLYDSTYVTIWKRPNCKGQRLDQCFPDPGSVGRGWWLQGMREFFGSDVLLLCCAESCPTLSNPMDCSLLDPTVHGILQARTPGQFAVPSSRGSSNPGIEPMSVASPASSEGFCYRCTIWEAYCGWCDCSLFWLSWWLQDYNTALCSKVKGTKFTIYKLYLHKPDLEEKEVILKAVLTCQKLWRWY